MDEEFKGTPVEQMPEGTEVELSPTFDHLFKGRFFKVLSHMSSGYTTIRSEWLGTMTVLSSEIRKHVEPTKK